MMRLRIRDLSAFLVVVASSSGCAHSTPSPSGITTTTDTVSGVVTVHLTGSPTPRRLQPLITLGTDAVLGSEPSPEEFGRVVSVIADSTGDVLVADGMGPDIRVFAPDGRFLRRLGRRGGGPGEFGGLHGIAWLSGDTLLALDYGNARLTLMEEDGRYVGQWPWLRLTGDARFLFNGGPGEVYVHAFRPRTGGGPLRSAWVRYTRAGPRDSLDVPQIAGKPGTSEICRGDKSIGFESNPFGDRPMSRPAPGEERVVAWTGSYRLAFVSPSGDTTRVVSRDIDPVPLADSLWAPFAKEYDAFQKSWHGQDCEGGIERPQNRPVLRDIVFDYDGRMLVEHTTASGMAFDVLTADGAWVETFPSPPDRDTSVPPFLRGDRLYLVTKDTLDVQRVRGFRIE